MSTHESLNGYTIVFTLVIAFVLFRYAQVQRRNAKFSAVGPSGPLSSYITAIQFIRDARSMMRKAVKKYNTGTFVVPLIDRWMVIVNTPELIEEIQTAPNNKLSVLEAFSDILSMPWTFGPTISTVPYHTPIIRSQLTRNIVSLFKDVHGEIVAAFEDIVPSTEGWTALPAYDTILKIVGRTSNRIFVGLPLCRDPDYLDLNITFTADVVVKSYLISMVPYFLKPIIGILFKRTDHAITRGIKHLGPTIEHRLKAYAEYGKGWADKPNDVLQWLIDEAPEEERTVPLLTRRILLLNFTAIHTTSTTFTQVLYHLAARPKYLEPIREEVERIIGEYGWTKQSMAKMHKLDSFMKESLRHGSMLTSLTRKALVDYTLSDGTFLPAGTLVSVNSDHVHFDDANHANPHEFDGFRFCRVGDETDLGSHVSVEQRMVTTRVDYVSFGHGKHACPGRFLAVNEMKIMMAYVVMQYDIRAEEEGVYPEDVTFGTAVVPNPKAKVLFRNRQPFPA